MEDCYSKKVTLLHGCFSRFLNCANGTKSHNASLPYTISRVEVFQNATVRKIFSAVHKTVLNDI